MARNSITRPRPLLVLLDPQLALEHFFLAYTASPAGLKPIYRQQTSTSQMCAKGCLYVIRKSGRKYSVIFSEFQPYSGPAVLDMVWKLRNLPACCRCGPRPRYSYIIPSSANQFHRARRTRHIVQMADGSPSVERETLKPINNDGTPSVDLSGSIHFIQCPFALNI